MMMNGDKVTVDFADDWRSPTIRRHLITHETSLCVESMLIKQTDEQWHRQRTHFGGGDH
jgi:hypothetical protein